MPKTIALDFDGVLHGYSKGWNGGAIYDPPVQGAVEGCRELQRQGYDLVVFTTRENLNAVDEFLCAHGFPSMVITNQKPLAMLYIDDRAYRFGDWENTLKEFHYFVQK